MITLGNILFFIFGLAVGAGIMYGLELFWDWKEDREDAQREAVIREALERLREKEATNDKSGDQG